MYVITRTCISHQACHCTTQSIHNCDTLLFWHTSHLVLCEEANELYRNHHIKCGTCTSIVLAVPYTWQTTLTVHYTWQTLHSLYPTPDKHYPHFTPDKLRSLCPTPEKTLHLYSTIHWLCPTPNIHCTRMVAPVPNMLWQLDHSCPWFAVATTADTGHTLVQI